MALDRLLVVALSITCCGALGVGLETRKTSDAEAVNSSVIPAWKLDLVAGDGHDWWTRFGFQRFATNIQSAIWGDGLPQITGSPAQDLQRCPVLKLPDDAILAAKRRSWLALYGEWSTANGVTLATWEQNYLGMGFSRDIKRIGVYIRSAATGQVAIRTRYFTDEEMLRLYDWKMTSNQSWDESLYNLAIFDCVGTLMYVVKGQLPQIKGEDLIPNQIKLYSRDATLLAKSDVQGAVLRYQFVDPNSNYLIATAEAPGINASIKSADIPSAVEVGDVLPFGFHFESGGYTNSSAFMDPGYRWVLAAAVQALAIYKAQAVEMPWTIITVVEATLITAAVLAALLVVGLLYGTFRCVYPVGYLGTKDYYGRFAENPFLAVPPCPPAREYGSNKDV